MSDPWKADLPIREDNIINESERSVNPADDEYKLVKLEDDGFLSEEWYPVFSFLREEADRLVFPLRRGFINQVTTLATPADSFSCAANGFAWDGNDFIYALRGNNTQTFYRYQISTNTWTTLAVTGVNMTSNGSSLIWTGGDFLYATVGGSTGFRRYQISTNTWTAMTATATSHGDGANMVYTGGDFIYALAGGTTNTLRRYSISGNSWSNMANATGNGGAGAQLVYCGGDLIYRVRGNTTADFQSYSIADNSWGAEASTPATINTGQAVYDGFSHIILFSGSNIFRYNIATGVWSQTRNFIPATTFSNEAGAICDGQNNIYIRNSSGSDFNRFSGVLPVHEPYMK